MTWQPAVRQIRGDFLSRIKWLIPGNMPVNIAYGERLSGCYSVPSSCSRNFYKLDSHHETCVTLANLRWSLNKIQIQNQFFSCLVMVIMKCMWCCWFYDWIHGFLSIVFVIECGVVDKIWRCSLISFKIFVFYGCLLYDPHMITHTNQTCVSGLEE